MWVRWCIPCCETNHRSNLRSDSNKNQLVVTSIKKCSRNEVGSPEKIKLINSSEANATQNDALNVVHVNKSGFTRKDVHFSGPSQGENKMTLDVQYPLPSTVVSALSTSQRQPQKDNIKLPESDDEHTSPTAVPSYGCSSRPVWTLQDVFESPGIQYSSCLGSKKLSFLQESGDNRTSSSKEKLDVCSHDRHTEHCLHSHQQPFFLPRIHKDPSGSQLLHSTDHITLTSSKSFPIRRGSMIVRGGRTTSSTTNATPDIPPCGAGVEGFIVTPFAQVLVSMQRIRNAFIRLTSAQTTNRFGAISSAVPEPSQSDFISPENEEYKSTANETLEELEWCLKQLENIQTKRPVSDMTFSKFKRLLNKELNNFGESDKSRNEISAYICNTFLEDEKDTEANQEIEMMLERRRSSGQSHGSGTASASDPSTSVAVSGNRSRSVLSPLEEGSANSSRTTAVGELNQSAASKPESHQLDTGKIPSVNADYLKDSSENSSLKDQSPTTQSLPLHGIETPNDSKLEEMFIKYLDVWGIDIFEVDRVSGGHALTTTGYRIFQNRDLLKTFTVDPSTFVRYFLKVEANYHPHVPYHNALHAADVLQTSHFLLQADTLEDVFSDLEIFAVLFASAIHDVDHPGLTNQFLINTGHDLALQYNDLSVLENHHLYVGFKLLNEPGCDILEGWSAKKRQTLRRMVIELVLATDMSKHMSLLADLRTMVETKKVSGSGVLNLDNYADRIQILQNMIHCADLSNLAKPLALNRKWTSRLMEEFFRQGDKERSLQLEISPMCDRESVVTENSQVSFIDFVAHPLLESWCDLVHPAAQEILDILEDNREWYQSQADIHKNPAATTITNKLRPRLATAEEDDEEECKYVMENH